MIEFAKHHPVFVTFCVITGIYAIAFILCLLQAAKDHHEDQQDQSITNIPDLQPTSNQDD